MCLIKILASTPVSHRTLMKTLALLFWTILMTSTAMASRPAKYINGAPRTVFVQLFEWRWADVARECEVFLGPRGFAAVQISPPNEHARKAGNPWWERYQPVGYNLVSRSGNQADFEDMVRRCRAAGVEIYADVVIN